MGTWGFRITDDDIVSDIISSITDELKAGNDLEHASARAREKFAELEGDADEAPLLWLALAHVQWKYGTVENQVLQRVRDDISIGNGLERWGDDSEALARRKAALAKFLAQIESPNPRPSKFPKVIIRRAPYSKGDCLAVLLPDGRFTAALVLNVDDANPEYGKNLIASLDYLERTPPDIDVFKRKKWLILNHGNWNNRKDICWYLPPHYRAESKRISKVGNIGLGWFVPKDDGMHASWRHIGSQILLCRDGIEV